jgi:polyisoprenyl-teichoic acid--peptidoglycan teichoic acid transferase
VKRRVLKIVAGVVSAAVLSVAGLSAAWLAGVQIPFASGATYLKIQKLALANNAGAPNGTFFVLLVGSDLRPGVGGARGDALHLVGINPSHNAVSMIDIPRDTCFNGDKINAQNSRGGPRGQANAVSQLLGGVPISFVIEVDFAGFTNVIDGMGGLSVNVPFPMHDRYSGAYFSPGVQHMNGGQALAFSRDRHDFPNSDIKRTENQGLLLINALSTMQKNARSAGGEFKLLALIGRHARLDGIGVKDLYRLGRIAHRIDPAKVRNVVWPTGGGGCLAPTGAGASLAADFRDDAILQSH